MATATITRPLRGSRVSTFYLVKNLPSLASLDSAFQLQEYISLLIRRDVHDVEAIVSLPTSSSGGGGKEGEASGSGNGGKEGEKNEVMVDEACWIYEQLRRLAQDLSHPLITTLQQECTRASCPEMKAGEWLYLCVAHGNDGAMEQCCAIDYILHTVDSATALLNSPRTFPSRLQIPATSHRHFSSLARRLGRIFAHAYFHHREAFEQAEAESSLYARFLALTSKFDLVPAEFLVIPSAQFTGEEGDNEDVPRYSQGREGGSGAGGYSGQPMLREEDHRQFERNHQEQQQQQSQLQQLQNQQQQQIQHQQQRYAEENAGTSSPSGSSPGGGKGRLTRPRTDTMIFSDAEASALTEELGARRGEGEQQSQQQQELVSEPEPQPQHEPEEESHSVSQEKEPQPESEHEEEPEAPLTARPALGAEEEQFEILLSPGEEVPAAVELEGEGGESAKTTVESEFKAGAEVEAKPAAEAEPEPKQQAEAPTTAEEPMPTTSITNQEESVVEPVAEPTVEPKAVEPEPEPESRPEFEIEEDGDPFDGIDDSMAEVELHLLERPSGTEKSEAAPEGEASPAQEVQESTATEPSSAEPVSEEGTTEVAAEKEEYVKVEETPLAAESISVVEPAASSDVSSTVEGAPLSKGETSGSATVETAPTTTPADEVVPSIEVQLPTPSESAKEAGVEIPSQSAEHTSTSAATTTEKDVSAVPDTIATKEPETKIEGASEDRAVVEPTTTAAAATSSEEEVSNSLITKEES